MVSISSFIYYLANWRSSFLIFTVSKDLVVQGAEQQCIYIVEQEKLKTTNAGATTAL